MVKKSNVRPSDTRRDKLPYLPVVIPFAEFLPDSAQLLCRLKTFPRLSSLLRVQAGPSSVDVAQCARVQQPIERSSFRRR